MVATLARVVPLTSAAAVSTSRRKRVANIDTIAATGAEAATTTASSMSRGTRPRSGTSAATTRSGNATSRRNAAKCAAPLLSTLPRLARASEWPITIIASGVLRSAMCPSGADTTAGSGIERRNTGSPAASPTVPGFTRMRRIPTPPRSPCISRSPHVHMKRLNATM